MLFRSGRQFPLPGLGYQVITPHAVAGRQAGAGSRAMLIIVNKGESVDESVSHSVVSNSLQTCGL